MARFNSDDDLSETQQVVLILRLTLDRDARLHHGELLDIGATGQGRFSTLAGLGETLQRWLDRQRGEAAREQRRPR